MESNLEKLIKLDKEEITDTPKAKKLAKAVYKEGLPSHDCYWNDRFYIAIKFDLDKELKLESARNLLHNARAGYFEEITHFGFNIRELLNKKYNLDISEKLEGYRFLDSFEYYGIASKLGLIPRFVLH